MNKQQFKSMIESGNCDELKQALILEPHLANQCVSWFLNQENHSDPLHYVCDCVFNGWLKESRSYEIAKLLIESDAQIEGSKGKESPLIAATSLSNEKVAKLLIDSGAELEVMAVFGARPLHWAAFQGLVSVVELLIHKGAEIEAKCAEYAATPLFWTVHGFIKHGSNAKTNPILSAKALLNAGANLDTKNKQGMTALKCSQQADSMEMFELLSSYTKLI